MNYNSEVSCKNQWVINNEYKDTIVFYNKKSLDLKTKESIKENDFSAEHVKLATKKKYFCKKLFKTSRIIHITKLNNKIITDLTKYSGIAKCVNHFCESSYQITVWYANRILKIGMFTIRNASTNKEITADCR